MAIKGFLRRPDAQTWLVGAEDHDYTGPVARVSHDNTWLYIVTDDYEGSVAINIEALPFLRRALAQIAKERAK